jgi:type I restriction-modification system DNA methylase subunit
MSAVTILQDRLEEMSNTCQEDPGISEQKLRRIFDKQDLLQDVFQYPEEDVHAGATIQDRKETDIHCTDPFGNVTVVIEFKKPSEALPGEHLNQLWLRYMKPLKADYGVLFNGLKWILYRRKGNDFQKICTVNTQDIQEHQAKTIYQHLKRPDYNTTKIDNVVSYFEKFEAEHDRLELTEEASREHFYQNFDLEKTSAFGQLVNHTVQLFQYLQEENNKFLQSAFDFWKRSYAKSPDKDEIPNQWNEIMDEADLGTSEEELYVFMFCLETAYAVFARLILAKSGEDYGFPDVRFSEFVKNEVKASSFRDDIAQGSWAKITMDLIRDMEEKMVSSVFEEDIFYWWTEPYEDLGFKDFFREKSSLEMAQFGSSMARVLLMLYKFNFSEITGDPLGILYQKYFDKETRKALGEFYTPQEVVDYILDSVGYEGQKILDKRLLDPACGSGTFLVTALKRYLEASEERAQEVGWDQVLSDLCNKYRIVGFDVHPFATIMAQIQFMLVLLPYYRRAIEDNRHFVLERVPVFRTDSLQKAQTDGQLKLQEFSGGRKFSMSIELPVKGDREGDFFQSTFEMPAPKTVRESTDIYNNEEYFGALQALFDVVNTQAEQMSGHNEPVDFDRSRFEDRAKHYLSSKNWRTLSNFFKPFADDLLEKCNTLQSEFDDGRLIKSIEDNFLASLLKTQNYDYVVGNPPYVRTQNLPDDQKDYLNSTYKSTTDSWDLYCPFIERGIEWLTESGRFGYITPNQFMVTDYGEGIREVMLESVRVEELFDFRDSGVFQDVTNYPVIITLEKEADNTSRSDNEIRGIRVKANVDEESGRELDQEVVTRVRQNRNMEEYRDEFIDVFEFHQSELDNGYWSIMPPDEYRVFQKLEDNSDDTLKNVTDSVFAGTQTSANKVYIVTPVNMDQINPREGGQTVKVKPREKDEIYCLETDLLSPWLDGSSIQRWQAEWKGQHVILPYEIQEDENGNLESRLYDQNELESNFPLTWDYLQEHKGTLENREGGKMKDREDWYGFIYPKSHDRFELPKIIGAEISNQPKFMNDDFGRWYFKTGYGVQLLKEYRNSTSFITSLLNSSALDFYLKHISSIKSGGYYKYTSHYLEKLPISWSETGHDKVLDKISNLINLENRINRFPSAYLSNEELTSKTVIMQASHSGLDPDIAKISPGELEVTIGSRKKEKPFVVESEEKANFITETLSGRNVRKKEEVEVLIPKSNKETKRVLSEYNDDKRKLDQSLSISELEEKIDQKVYDLYNLEDNDIRIIKQFLESF